MSRHKCQLLLGAWGTIDRAGTQLGAYAEALVLAVAKADRQHAQACATVAVSSLLLVLSTLLLVSTCVSCGISNQNQRGKQRVAQEEAKRQQSDSRGDGTPDFLRLEDSADQEAFRRWFTFLAEIQYFTPRSQRPEEITDCAALLRYAYREALRLHDAKWSAASHLPLIPALESVRKYQYPHTLLGPALFRIRPGGWSPADLHSGAFAQFADAETLQRWSTFLISREIGHAQSGDLLFYRRAGNSSIFHSMIFLGNSQVTPGAAQYVVYDTGTEGARAGEIRRLSVNQLLHFPDAQWQPRSTNPVFLGVFRWNILNTGS